MALGGSSAANAIVINGLDWLPLSNTISLSHNDVNTMMQPGGSLEDYRFATLAETQALFSTVHPGWVAGGSSSNQGMTAAIGTLLGFTWWAQSGNQIEVHAVTGESLTGACCREAYQLADGFRGFDPTIDLVVLGPVNTNSTSVFSRPIAHYVVNKIPEPAAFWLVASGILGGFGIARQRR